MTGKHYSPSLDAGQFHCPRCGVYASQTVCKVTYYTPVSQNTLPEHKVTLCHHCDEVLIWHKSRIIFPEVSIAPSAHEDMPSELINDYNEASSILTRSPRGAAALLRLVLQKLMVHLGEKGKNINDDIGSLVEKGLPIEIQKALDAVRIVGNSSVHPGEINLNDTPEIATALFGLINFIIDDRIARPKRIDALYSKLPAKAVAAVADRDS